MDFIERSLHISLDGGNGTLELLLFLVPVMLGCTIHRLRRREAPISRCDVHYS